MPSFGVCCSPDHSAAARDAGFAFAEANAQAYLQPRDAAFSPQAFALPVPSLNGIMPGDLRIVGPDVSTADWQSYLTTLFDRAGRAGVRTIVFGSGKSRGVPEGWSRDDARKQILEFLTFAAEPAERANVTVVIEPLNKGECNIINTVAEAMTYVDEIDRPSIRCLLDTYHFWLENEPLENLIDAGGAIAHVHVADRDGRTFPGVSGRSDYEPVFTALQKIGYDGRIAIEARGEDNVPDLKAALSVLKRAWTS